MRVKEGFVLRDICGEKVISGEGVNVVNFSKLITLNETAAFLWEQIQNKDFDAETLADILCDNYEVERELALKDSKALLDQWLEMGIIE